LSHRRGDHVHLVWDDDDAAQRDAELAQLLGEKRRVAVGDLSGKDLIPDDDQRSRGIARHQRPQIEIASFRKSLLPMRILTQARLRALSARCIAGRMSSGRSTYSPCPPSASTTFS